MKKPDCYLCTHRRGIAGDAHSYCKNFSASVKGDPHGIRKGWFFWPFNFDPVWLESCNGFKERTADKTPDLIDEGGSF